MKNSETEQSQTSNTKVSLLEEMEKLPLEERQKRISQMTKEESTEYFSQKVLRNLNDPRNHGMSN